MRLEFRDKKKGPKRLINSFKYAFEGFKTTIICEQNMTIHLFMASIVLIFGLFFNIKLTEWMFLILISALVMATELINTSIEAVVDLVEPKKNPLAKIAKDTAAAAVLVFALAAILIGFIIFVPKILSIWGLHL